MYNHLQEIENDKKNAENFSLEATQRMKTRSTTGNVSDNNSSTVKQTTRQPEKVALDNEPTAESRKIKRRISDASAIVDFRPQRLSEVCQLII